MPRFFAEDAPVQPVRSSSPFSAITNPLSTILDILQRPVSATAGATLALQTGESPLVAARSALAGETRNSWEDVLAQAGVQPGLGRTAGGLAGDLALDPLNVAGAPLVKGAGKLLGPLAGKVADLPIVRPILDDLGKKFVPYYGLPDEYAKSRRLLESEKGFVRHKAIEDSINRFRGTDAGERAALTRLMETGPSGNAKLDALRQSQADAFDVMRQREMDAGVLDPDRAVKDYVTYLFGGAPGRETLSGVARKPKALSGANRFNQRRSVTTIDEALKLGAEPDIAKISAIRQYAGEKAILHTNFVEAVTKNPEWAQPADVAPMDWVKINIPGEAKLQGMLQQFAFAPEIAQDLTKLLDVGQARGDIAKMFDTATSVWKAYATVLKPGFHVRNLYSNVFNSWLGGMGPADIGKRYAEAIEWGLGRRPSTVGRYSAAEVEDAMQRYGVEGVEFGASGMGDIGERIEEELTRKLSTSRLSAANPLSQNFLPTRVGRKVGSTVEDLSRRALFLDQVAKGSSLENAALHVKKYLFDYSELTDFERNVLRRAMPFYTWIRKNLPLQLGELAKQPQKFAAVSKTIEAVERQVPEDQRVQDADRPEYLQELGAVQLPESGAGARFLNPNLPYQDLGKLPIAGGLSESLIKGLRDVGSMTNPALKGGIEWMTNRDLFRDRPLYDEKVGPQNMVKAPAVIAALAKVSPDAAAALGARLNQRTGQWEMPADTGYAISQAPVLQSLGRATTGIDPQAGTVALPEMLDFFGGIKTVRQSPEDQAKDRRFRLQRKAAERSAQRRDLAPLRRERIDDLYDRYLTLLNR
jgi:hypothetical protein